MLLKVYQKYIIKNFFITFFKITFVFISLGFVVGILEELNFFSEIDTDYFTLMILVLLNLPTLIYEIFPFIFLITSQFFFLNILENGELNTFKNKGLSNFKIIQIVCFSSFLFGLFVITFFYQFSSSMKFNYLDIKKNFTKDNKYLAAVTENGLWIKDSYDGKINFINSKKFSLNSLEEVQIIVLDKEFNFIKNIQSKKVEIKDNNWKLKNVKIIDNNNNVFEEKTMSFYSNFNYEEINNFFSNLSSQSIFELLELIQNYNAINYSTIEIEYHIQKIIAYPFLIMIITLLSSIIMLNIKHQRPKFFTIILGILFSVIIYYINFLFGTLGKNEKIPLLIAVWSPQIILIMISLIGLIRINEK